ncbi:uncharacterized protein BX663DRAFT_521780, partial [Cokeromyces recurvatus]|uniref:uncharacterized protein n=1 Tax=Cokeromyces recurvatus TaxID=90255 RepID=UPI00221E7FBF
AIKNENLADVSLCGLDPNRYQVFAAAYGEEYYTVTGSTRHAKRETKKMSRENIEDILFNIPTTKTAVLSNYLQYITYTLLHLNRILEEEEEKKEEERQISSPADKVSILASKQRDKHYIHQLLF